MRRRFALLAGALALSAAAAGAAAQDAPRPGEGPFDYYVLTLSWSPGFCDSGGAAKSPDQCAVGANRGFVVHGLWPDSADGADPAYCREGADVPYSALRAAHGLYPADGLAAYEYRKHGTCTGLDAAGYFDLVRYVRAQVLIPPSLQAPRQAMRVSPEAVMVAFIAANANLTRDNMAVTCSGGELEDVRICVSKDLKAFANCPKVAGHTCRAGSILVAPPR